MEHDAYLEMGAVESRHWWFTGRRRILAAVIASLNLPPQARILELGAGTGGNFEMLQRFGQLTAVEMNDTARELSQANAGAATLHPGMLPDQLPLADQTFDLVCLFDVLEHIEDDAATLRVIRGLLAPGGVAMITVPAHPSLFGPHDTALHHKRRYTRAELNAKLRAAGFTVRKLSFMNVSLLPVAIVLRWLDKALGSTQATGTKIPSPPVNTAMAWIFGAEAWLLPRHDLPFGLSLLALASATD